MAVPILLLMNDPPRLSGFCVTVLICLLLCSQGAPETIQERLIDLPASYVETYKKYTRQGSRVLALAYKPLPDMTVRNFRDIPFCH